MNNPRLVSIEWGLMDGQRPRSLGQNARLPVHGDTVREPIARVRFDDGSSGFGYSEITPAHAETLLGRDFEALISLGSGAVPDAHTIEFPLWDALGNQAGKPVYRLLADQHGLQINEPFNVPCYDTSLYFDDLHLADDTAAAALIAQEACEGYERGHRAFKIKIGRGAMFMPLIEGTQRDIAIIRAVREAIGPGLPLMIDANNGYNYNMVQWVLRETADCDLYWFEEPFHEDPVLYQHLHEWMQAEGLSVLIADGEGVASPLLMDWVRDGHIDVVQYDTRLYGFSPWLRIAPLVDMWGAKSAPHNYGSAYGNYTSCHLAAALAGFTFTEWDTIALHGLDDSGYSIHDGLVTMSTMPGFGLGLDNDVFTASVEREGFSVSL